MSEKLSDWNALEESPFEPIFVARQPVFDRDHEVWGYELLFRHSGMAEHAVISDADSATAQVIVDGVSLALSSLNEQRRILINFPQKLLLQGTSYALPRETCVVELLESVLPTTGVVDACSAMKKAGYTLALDDYQGDKTFAPLLRLADIVKVDMFGLAPSELIRITKDLADYPAVLLAEKVEDERTYLLARALGYSLFQGYYFSRPEIFPGRKISIGTIARLRLLRELLNDDYDVKKLSRIITTDAPLSYRLLRYVNSLAFALRNKVRSISQAVAYLGSMALRQWLMAVAIADVAPTPRSEELAFRCVQRAKFLELIALFAPHLRMAGEEMFLLGLFSNLHLLLGLSMEELFKEMPLDEDMKRGLQEQKSDSLNWLELTYAIEAGNWGRVELLAGQLGLDRTKAAQAHAYATNWVNYLFRFSQEEKIPPSGWEKRG